MINAVKEKSEQEVGPTLDLGDQNRSLCGLHLNGVIRMRKGLSCKGRIKQYKKTQNFCETKCKTFIIIITTLFCFFPFVSF